MLRMVLGPCVHVSLAAYEAGTMGRRRVSYPTVVAVGPGEFNHAERKRPMIDGV
jgi:hypothetical protein